MIAIANEFRREGEAPTPPPFYLAALDLRGRDVLVVGGGVVATRRLTALLDANAMVTVVAPAATERIEQAAQDGRIAFHGRPYADGDVEGRWYVLALTNDPAVNATVAAACERQHVFCVRGDDATGGSARTPASGAVGGLRVGVVGERDPRRSAAARDVALEALRAWSDL